MSLKSISSRRMKSSGSKLILIPESKSRYIHQPKVATTDLSKLLSGTAEIFGTEIVTEQTYTFVGKKAAIFTYHGATLSIKGSPNVAYVAEETPMLSYANLHFALEKLRQLADDNQSKGPRVLIIGSEDAGKTSLTKILISYAVRQGRKPIVVGLDPKQVLLFTCFLG